MRLGFSPAAARDLSEIAAYIARDDRWRARQFIEAIRRRCAVIAMQPEASPLRRELGSGVRACPFRNYRIFYRVLDNVVRIERVLHAARDVSAIMMPDHGR